MFPSDLLTSNSYYELFRPLLDTSQMANQEAFGSWGWYDGDCVIRLATMIRNISRDDPPAIPMYEVLALVGYLFAGAENTQLGMVRRQTIGIIGKLTLVWSALLGSPVREEDLGKFTLLDVDPTCIPCSSAGIITPGHQTAVKTVLPRNPNPEDVQHTPTTDMSPQSLQDFTIHIEPDWGYDTQACLVTYRYKGRIVDCLSPWLIAISAWRKFSAKKLPPRTAPSSMSSQAIPHPRMTSHADIAGRNQGQ